MGVQNSIFVGEIIQIEVQVVLSNPLEQQGYFQEA